MQTEKHIRHLIVIKYDLHMPACLILLFIFCIQKVNSTSFYLSILMKCDKVHIDPDYITCISK